MMYTCQTLEKYFGRFKADRTEAKHVEEYISRRSKQNSQKTGTFITSGTGESGNHRFGRDFQPPRKV